MAPDGSSLPLQLLGEAAPTAGSTRVLLLSQAAESFTFRQYPGPARALALPLLLPRRVLLRYDYTDAELSFLMAHDPDEFNVWGTPGRRSFCACVRRLVEGGEGALGEPLNPLLIAALRAALNDGRRDPRLVAEAIRTPDEGYLLEQFPAADPQRVERALRHVRLGLASALRDDLLAIYTRYAGAAYQNDATAIGRRRLKNVCLGYLMTLNEPELCTLAQSQYENGDNIDRQPGRLGRPWPIRSPPCLSACCLDFYTRWQSEPLVIDKWFSVQATSKRADTLERVPPAVDPPHLHPDHPQPRARPDRRLRHAQ